MVCGWLAYEQWKHDDAISGWVVVFGTIALLYNPLLPVHLPREVWSVLNLVTAILIVGHLWALRRLITDGVSLESDREQKLMGPNCPQKKSIRHRISSL